MAFVKISLDKEREFNLSSTAVEAIEEHYDCALDEIFQESKKLRAKDINYILYKSLVESDISLEEFKIELSKKFNYNETIQILNQLMGEIPNEAKADIQSGINNV